MNIQDYKRIYMCGIGGISMSGIAQILQSWDFEVLGSDGVSSNITNDLIRKGVKVFIGQRAENVTSDIDLFVYTAAIREDNPEIVRARELGVPMIERGEFLGKMTTLFKKTIGISGTHGKTTTTSMVTCIFLAASMDPSVQVGSLLKQIGGNFRVGNSDYFIIEACEYCDSFLNFKQHGAVVTNIDNDHLDYFKSLDNIVASFRKYMENISEDGFVVINRDDENAMKIVDSVKAKLITYSIVDKADVYAQDIRFDENGCGLFALYQQNELLGEVHLSVPGLHNVSNAVGAAAISLAYGVDFEAIRQGLSGYEGASRRLEFKGEFKGAKVYDDYGHHPTEIVATERAVHQTRYNKSWVIFEPHTYSRTYEHLDEFAKALSGFDNIIVIDIYAARETNEFGVTEQMLVDKIKVMNSSVVYISDYEDICKYLEDKVSDGDIILTLGAGSVTKVGELLVKKAK